MFHPDDCLQLVDKDSACLLGLPDQSLDVPHGGLNKFRGPDDPNFKRVSGVLRDMVQEAKRIASVQQKGIKQSPDKHGIQRYD